MSFNLKVAFCRNLKKKRGRNPTLHELILISSWSEYVVSKIKKNTQKKAAWVAAGACFLRYFGEKWLAWCIFVIGTTAQREIFILKHMEHRFRVGVLTATTTWGSEKWSFSGPLLWLFVMSRHLFKWWKLETFERVLGGCVDLTILDRLNFQIWEK